MDTDNKSIGNFNDLLFENKHKEYGAYAIRKSYNDNVTRALFITLLFFSILATTVATLNKGKDKIPDTSGNITPVDSVMVIPFDNTPIDKPKDEPKVLPKEPDEPKIASGQMIASNEENKIPVETNENMKVSSDPNPNGKYDSTASSGSETFRGTIKLAPEKIEIMPEIMPELANMNKFISENLQYPPIAVENGTSGIVYVTFVVEKDGSLSNVGILKGIGDGCEQEAIRVIKMLPKWKPGQMQGNPVRVQCNLPVSFRLK